jgi:hypothetical protein
MKSIRPKVLSAILLGLSVLIMSGCEQKVALNEIIAIYPAANAEVAPGSIPFKWISNAFGPYHFRLGNAEMTTVLVDTVLNEDSLRIDLPLQRKATYRWEVTQGTAKLSQTFVAADVATLALLSPLAGDSLPLTGNTFFWASNSAGPFRFRLGDASMTNILVDQNVSALSYTPVITLAPNTAYRWEIRVEDQTASELVHTANVPLITLLAPAASATVPPCCALAFDWQSILPSPFQFRLGMSAPFTGLLDTTIAGTSWVYGGGLAPGMTYFWEVQQGAALARQTLRVQPLEVMFPSILPGTWYTQRFDPVTGLSSQTYPGAITVSNVNNGAYGKVGTGNPIQFASVNASLARYYVGDSLNYERLDVFFGSNQVIYEYRITNGNTFDRGRFVYP